jgi:hypothetical protein
MDWRLHPQLENQVRERVGGSIDLVMVPGGVQALLGNDQPAVRDFLLHSIEISVRLHGIGRLVLANHTDCGAYGGRQAFASDQAEQARHQADLRAARQVIEQRISGLAFDLVLVTLGDSGTGWQVRLDTLY